MVRTNPPAEVVADAETVTAYKSLSRVERAFRSIKAVAPEIRPIFHRTSPGVKAHVFPPSPPDPSRAKPHHEIPVYTSIPVGIMPLMAKRDPDHTRQGIIDAAFAEIHRQGFQAASVAAILADTGLTKGALYHHFPDKKALGLAVVEEVIRPRFFARLLEPVRTAAAPLAAFRAVVEQRRQTVTEAEVALGCPVNNLMQEMSPLDEDFRMVLTGLVTDWRDTLTAAFARARAAGEIRAEIDPEAAALFAVSSIWGCIGVAKSLQSASAYRICLGQLVGFLDTLSSQPKENGHGPDRDPIP